MNNLVVIAVILFVLWVAIFAFYFFIVRNQRELESEIDAVESLLTESEKPVEEES